MKKLLILIGNSGDGSNHLRFFDGDKFSKSQIAEAAEKDPYDSYQSGDGIQIYALDFPDSTDFSNISLETVLPGQKEDDEDY